MVLTDDDKIAELCLGSRNLCFQESRRFHHERIGWNFRMTNIQAAIGLAQLERLDQTISLKSKIGEKYNELLKGCSSLQLPLPETSYARNVYWVYPVVLNDCCPMTATEAMARLGEQKIGTRPFFYPMHNQPVFRKMGLFEDDSHGHSERLAERGFYIPAGIGISEEEIHQVADCLLETVQG